VFARRNVSCKRVEILAFTKCKITCTVEVVDLDGAVRVQLRIFRLTEVEDQSLRIDLLQFLHQLKQSALVVD
jgi:hypothetical protein